MVTTAGWFFLMSIFAIRLHMDAFNTFTSAAYIFLMFLSTMFYPLADLPGWFQWAARINPMTWQVDMLRFSLLGTGAPQSYFRRPRFRRVHDGVPCPGGAGS